MCFTTSKHDCSRTQHVCISFSYAISSNSISALNTQDIQYTSTFNHSWNQSPHISKPRSITVQHACVRLAQLVRSLTANQKFTGSISSFGRPSFATPSVDRDVKPLVKSTFYRELERTHTLVDKSKLVPVLWTVTSSSRQRKS